MTWLLTTLTVSYHQITRIVCGTSSFQLSDAESRYGVAQAIVGYKQLSENRRKLGGWKNHLIRLEAVLVQRVSSNYACHICRKACRNEGSLLNHLRAHRRSIQNWRGGLLLLISGNHVLSGVTYTFAHYSFYYKIRKGFRF